MKLKITFIDGIEMLFDLEYLEVSKYYVTVNGTQLQPNDPGKKLSLFAVGMVKRMEIYR